ncbi:hypothetical protein ACLOJK_001104 [Asimina triloba]
MIALGCAFLIGLTNVAWTTIFKRQWAVIFTNDELVRALTTASTSIVGEEK